MNSSVYLYFRDAVVAMAVLFAASVPALAQDNALEATLQAEDPAALADEARQSGDAARGAVLFHQPYMNCVKCHSVGDDAIPLGPDLAKLEENLTTAHLVQSVLKPSAAIRQGYESALIVTDAGQTINGLFVEETPEAIVVRDVAQDGRLVRVDRGQIEEHLISPTSLMPTGLVNQLSSRQQFLDLIAYLIEIAEHGPARALELRPAASLIAKLEIPEYEDRVDHAGLIADLDGEAFQRGEAIYNRLCANCHGTHEAPGSMPTSLRFAEGKFKSGGDPHSMYQTLTRGFGLMPAQTWMVPQQKYDVIHYIREAYLKPHNPAQYIASDPTYLASLPKGDTRGPAPTKIEPWITMDYGPSLINTYEVGQGGGNIAYKGIAVRLDPGPGGVSRGRHWMIFDHDTLRMAAAWSGTGFIDWQGIHFDGRHGAHPHLVGDVAAANDNGPGWANPTTGRFEDPRIQGRDGKHYGPLPREWAHYKGLYHHGEEVVISYTVGEAAVLEQPGYETSSDFGPEPIYTRTLNIGKSPHDLVTRIAPRSEQTAVALSVDAAGDNTAELTVEDNDHLLRIAADQTPISLTVFIGSGDQKRLAAHAAKASSPPNLEPLTKGGPAQWPDQLQTETTLGDEDVPLAIDVLTPPDDNPWHCRMRLTGLDFLDEDRVAICSWDGDVWVAEGLARTRDDAAEANAEDTLANRNLTWRRIASGLFQPLGLKIIDGKIFVTCRDQITVLHDLNGDGETDFYENFNNDHQVTEHFHEFAMGLQADDEGNLYYAKSARHAKTALVPHHGTLLRVSNDGQQTDILATGFRAANGVCLNPDGTFFVTDQEGHWIPKNRINWVREGGFYGNIFGYHNVTDTSDEAMEPPLCWITNAFDRSPSELVWVDSDRWGPLKGSLLNLSYGYGKIYVVPHEKVDDQLQGGMVELPLPQFPTGVMRARFHSSDGHLYICGMNAWGSNQTQAGGFYRVRPTGEPLHVPIGLRAKENAMVVEFSERLDPQTATDPSRWAVKVWSLRRSAKYGSDHHDERTLQVTAVQLSEDGRTATVQLPELEPTWSMEIKYTFKSATGKTVNGTVHNTIHQLVE